MEISIISLWLLVLLNFETECREWRFVGQYVQNTIKSRGSPLKFETECCEWRFVGLYVKSRVQISWSAFKFWNWLSWVTIRETVCTEHDQISWIAFKVWNWCREWRFVALCVQSTIRSRISSVARRGLFKVRHERSVTYVAWGIGTKKQSVANRLHVPFFCVWPVISR